MGAPHMIVAQLEHWSRRLSSKVWARAFTALERVGPDSPEETNPLGEDGMFMRIMSYPTRAPDAEDAILESHQLMVDVQMALRGGERIDWFPADSLVPKAPYDAGKDRYLYQRPGIAPASVDVLPGTFVILFPEDAHMPQLFTTRGDLHVKKVVVKVPIASLSGT